MPTAARKAYARSPANAWGWLLIILACTCGPALADSGYPLNAGDSIRIHVYGEPDLSFAEILIGQDGVVAYPFLGEINLAGMTVSELRDTLIAGLKPDYLIDPRISVSIVRYRPFFVNGQVNRPGGVAFQPGLTLRKAIALAGGFTERANKKQVLLIADADPQRKEVEVGLDYRVQPGDIITVQQRFF